MTPLLAVVDASLVMKAMLPNQDLARCQAVLAHLGHYQLVSPALWVYEITSTLSKAVHFEQLTPAEAQAALQHALALGVQVIPPDETQALLALEQTQRLQRAAAYGSFYLAIAEALDAEFWTADRRLARSFQSSPPAWLHSIDEF